MRAVVLAAGQGNRMGRLTEDRPKAMIEVAGRTLFDRQLATLRKAGIETVAVATGWHSELFDGYGLELFHNPLWAESTMVTSLECCRAWLASAPLVVAYGDILYSSEDVRALADSVGEISVSYDPLWKAKWEKRFDDPLEDCERFRLNGTSIVEIGGVPGNVDDVEGQYIGLLKFTPSGWEGFEAVLRALGSKERRTLDMTGALSHVVASSRLVVEGIPIRRPWFEFDQPSDLAAGRDAIEAIDAELEEAI
jgi:L-glutamine-phosphate cytidylyltransferase